MNPAGSGDGSPSGLPQGLNNESRREHVKVRVSEARSPEPTQGEIVIQYWSKKERTRRALKLGGACWAAGIACIVLPLVHFIAVPALILAGPIVAFIVSQQTSVITGGSGVCPHCQAPLTIVRAAVKFPLEDLCAQCKSSVRIERI